MAAAACPQRPGPRARCGRLAAAALACLALAGCATDRLFPELPAPPGSETPAEPAAPAAGEKAAAAPERAASAPAMADAPAARDTLPWQRTDGPVFDWRPVLARRGSDEEESPPPDSADGDDIAAAAERVEITVPPAADAPALEDDAATAGAAGPAEPSAPASGPAETAAAEAPPATAPDEQPAGAGTLPPWLTTSGPVFDWRADAAPAPAETAAPAEATLAPWQARERRLRDLAGWRLTGRVAIRSPEESWSAVVRWQQAGEEFQVRLSNPLGQGLMNLRGSPGEVYLQTAEGQIYRAPDAETLLRDAAGMSLPVSGLRYWVLAVQDPARAAADVQVDGDDLPATLDQAGWHIEYDRYRDTDDVSLPDRLRFEGETVSGRLVITQWEVTAP